MEMTVWNAILTGVVGIIVFLAKGKFEELDRVTILLNKTREEIARDHVTRNEYNRDLEKITDRFDASFQRLESKIDDLLKSKSSRRGGLDG